MGGSKGKNKNQAGPLVLEGVTAGISSHRKTLGMIHTFVVFCFLLRWSSVQTVLSLMESELFRLVEIFDLSLHHLERTDADTRGAYSVSPLGGFAEVRRALLGSFA